jgi:uncharacterized membrane protein YciS (DUF1049 family)
MKFIKWLLMFAVAFLAAWILIFTFIQEPFRQTAAARVLTWWTPAIPIYLYVAGAFVIGFAAGLVVALYSYFSLQSKVHQKNKEITRLERELSDANERVGRLTGQYETGDVSTDAVLDGKDGVGTRE